MLEELDPFFLNPTVGNKTKEILSSLNIPLLDYQSLLVDYEDLSIINQLHSTLYKTAYKAFYQQKIVLAEVYNLIYPPKDSATVGQINGASQMLATDDGKISLMIQLSIRKALSHEYFVGLLGVGYFQYHVDQPVQILVLSEYHEKNLDDIIRLEREEGYTSSWKEKLTWMKEILSGLLLLEKYSTSIKDLTSNNIFFNNQLKIKMKPEYEIINSKQPVVASEEEKNSRRPSATTPSHVVFNIGKIIFYMLTGITFQDYCSSSSSSSVASPSIEAAPVSDGCPEALRSLMLKCLEYQQARSLTTETLTIQTIWKELDNIWNTTFPPENPSNQLLKRLSLTSASASKLITMRSTSSDSHSGFNPFDDLEDFHNRVDRDRYYQDGMMSHRPSVVPRRPTVPSQDAMDHMFSHFSHLPPRHSHAQQHSHPYQHRRPSTHVNPHHSNNPFSSNDTSPLLSPTTLHLPPSVPNSHSHSSNTHAPSVYFDRREDILQHVINSLGRQFHIIESDLHENLELVENLYIVEASPRGINAEEKIKKKEEVKNFRQNIESFFHQVENIKKQLVFLYLYCDLEEEPEKELRSSIKKTNENPSTSDNPFLAFEQNEASRRQSQLKLLQLLQEILNDNPTSTTAPQQPLPPSTEDIYEFYRRNSHSLAPKEMKRRLSLLRQETTSTATNTSSEVTPPPSKGNSTSNSQRNSSALLSSPSLPPSNAPVMKGSKPDRSMSSGSDRAEGTAKEVNKAEEVRKSVAPKVEKKPLTAVKGDFLAEIRKKSVSSEEPPNVPAISLTPKESFTLPAPEVQKTETEVIESKPKAPSLKPAVSLSARLFNQLDEPMTTEDLASTAADPVTSAPAPPLSPPLTVTSSVPEKPKTAQKTSGGHVRRTSSYEALTQFNRGKTENIAPTEPGNNTKALQTTVAPPAVPSHPANGASAGNSKISGLVVGRKNSLIPLDNNTAAQMKQRKASLYLGNKPSEGDQQMTLESASGDMSLPSNSGFYSNSSPMGKIFGGTFQQEQLDDYNFDNSNNIIPFSASTTPSAAVTSKPPSNAPSGPIHFIYGRQISGNQGPPSPSPDSPSHPLAARKNPIEKATEFINRVKQLDSMYLTRAHDPYDETLTNRDPALAEELLNSNTSYLHQHTFTGALNRPTNSTEGGSKKEHLTTALTSFLKVIEKCQDTSSKAKNLVHQMDQGINQIGISNNTGSLGSGTVASSGGRGTGGVRSVSPTTLPRHMSPTYSASRKLSPKAIQKANARVNTLSSTFAPSDSLHGRRPVSPASTLSGSVTNSGRRTVGGGLNMNTGRNFFDNDEPNPLTNSFQSLYNVNNNTATMNASVNSYGRSSSPSKDRAKSPRIRYSIHQEKLSKNKSPVTYSFSPSKRR